MATAASENYSPLREQADKILATEQEVEVKNFG